MDAPLVERHERWMTGWRYFTMKEHHEALQPGALLQSIPVSFRSTPGSSCSPAPTKTRLQHSVNLTERTWRR